MNKLLTACIFLVLAVTLFGRGASAQSLAITNFSDGRLTWTTLPGTNTYTVEWASDLSSDAWSSTWTNLAYCTPTGTTATAQVPMYYRIRRSLTNLVTTLHVDSKTNCVNPVSATHTSFLSPGTYVVQVTGPGVSYGNSPAGYWAFIWAWSQVSTDPSRCIGVSTCDEKIEIPLEHGGWIGSFIIDSYTDDNAGFLDMKVFRK